MSKRLIARLASILLGLCFAVGLASNAAAQAISQPASSTNLGTLLIGQSFTATATGSVTQIAVRPAVSAAATLYLYNGVGTGASGAVGTPVSQQMVNLVTTASPGFQVITLNTPLPVTIGQSYSFAFDSADLRYQPATNPYAGGTFFFDGDDFTSFPGADLAFQVFDGSPPPVAVPTLSEWTLILFGMLLAGAAAFNLQRRRRLI